MRIENAHYLQFVYVVCVGRYFHIERYIIGLLLPDRQERAVHVTFCTFNVELELLCLAVFNGYFRFLPLPFCF